jgi:hypothetical protein
MMAPLVIAPRFCGPPDSGNGGYMCGLIVLVPEESAHVVRRHPSCTSREAAVCRMIRGGKRRMQAPSR